MATKVLRNPMGVAMVDEVDEQSMQSLLCCTMLPAQLLSARDPGQLMYAEGSRRAATWAVGEATQTPALSILKGPVLRLSVTQRLGPQVVAVLNKTLPHYKNLSCTQEAPNTEVRMFTVHNEGWYDRSPCAGDVLQHHLFCGLASLVIKASEPPLVIVTYNALKVSLQAFLQRAGLGDRCVVDTVKRCKGRECGYSIAVHVRRHAEETVSSQLESHVALAIIPFPPPPPTESKCRRSEAKDSSPILAAWQ